MKKLVLIIFILSFAFSGGSTRQYKPSANKKQIIIVRVIDTNGCVLLEKEIK